MKIFMIGGTGLLGSEAAAELIRRGHEVSSIALPPIPSGAILPTLMKVELGNYLELTDDEIRAHLAGCEGFIFAAGVDERVEGPAPIYNMFKKYNIDPVQRMLKLAKEVGVKHTVILGSYFTYFDQQWPQMELSRWHPYIRSRRDQEQMALSFADDGFDVAVLQLPYIFGVQLGRRPVWVFLVENLLQMKLATFYTRGGTTMVTVRQVGQAIAGALERNQGGTAYPIGYYNMEWKKLLSIMNNNLGLAGRRIITIPDWTFALAGKRIMADQARKGQQGGLNIIKYTAVQCAKLFIEPEQGCIPLGVEPDDIETAIGDSVHLSLDVIQEKVKAVAMKAE